MTEVDPKDPFKGLKMTSSRPWSARKKLLVVALLDALGWVLVICFALLMVELFS